MSDSEAGHALTGHGGRAEAEAYARRLAAVVAGHQGEAATAERLLHDDDAGVRAAALGALARCGALQRDQINQALGDEAAKVRCRAAELAPPGVELVGLLSDADPSVVEAVAAALGERDRDPGPVAELCRVARSHDEPLCRESAVAALGAIAAGLDAEAVAHDAARAMALEVLLDAMDDRPQIRRRALLGLHQFDDAHAVTAVRAGLEDRDRQVRAVAGELLGVPVH